MSDISGLDMLVILFVVSFALDRVVVGLLFALSWIKPWAHLVPDPRAVAGEAERLGAERRQKLAYFVLAAALAVLVLSLWGNVRLFAGLRQQVPAVLDILITGIILIGGSDLISRLLQIGGIGAAGESPPRPVEITGKLILEDSGQKKSDPGES